MTSNDHLAVSAANLQTFYGLFGQIAVTFSNMEFLVGEILEMLIDRHFAVVGGLITTDLPLSKKVEHIRSLTRFRFWNDAAMEARVLEAMRKVESLRVERNSFVHGMWNLDPGTLAQGRVSCWDVRWKASKQIKEWNKMRDKEWTFDQLIERVRQVAKLVGELGRLTEELRTAKMWEANRLRLTPPKSD